MISIGVSKYQQYVTSIEPKKQNQHYGVCGLFCSQPVMTIKPTKLIEYYFDKEII